jgi:hypothetical protein
MKRQAGGGIKRGRSDCWGKGFSARVGAGRIRKSESEKGGQNRRFGWHKCSCFVSRETSCNQAIEYINVFGVFRALPISTTWRLNPVKTQAFRSKTHAFWWENEVKSRVLFTFFHLFDESGS